MPMGATRDLSSSAGAGTGAGGGGGTNAAGKDLGRFGRARKVRQTRGKEGVGRCCCRGLILRVRRTRAPFSSLAARRRERVAGSVVQAKRLSLSWHAPGSMPRHGPLRLFRSLWRQLPRPFVFLIVHLYVPAARVVVCPHCLSRV